jgi:lipopolysaccharide export system permease protein
MKILSRYMLKEMFVPFLIGLAGIVMMLTGSVLYNNADIFLQNHVPVTFIVRLALYFVPFLINMTMPVGMAVAASLAVSRMARDSEITVLRASGASLVRIFMPIFVCGVFVSVADFYWGEYVVPASILRYMAVSDELPAHIKDITPPPGQYIVAPDSSYVIGVRNMIKQPGYIDLRGVSVVSGMKSMYGMDAQPFILSADKGRYLNGKWTLDSAQMYTYSLKDPDAWSRGTAQRITKYISVDPASFAANFQLNMPMGKMAGKSMQTFAQLGEELKSNKRLGIRDYSSELDYHFKMSVPFSCLVMALCCPPMALRFAKGGGFMGTLLSICLVFVYWNTLLLARMLGTPPAGGVPLLQPNVAAWSQNVLFVLLGLFVLRKSE